MWLALLSTPLLCLMVVRIPVPAPVVSPLMPGMPTRARGSRGKLDVSLPRSPLEPIILPYKASVASALLLAAVNLWPTMRLDRLLLSEQLLCSTLLSMQWLFMLARMAPTFTDCRVSPRLRPSTIAIMRALRPSPFVPPPVCVRTFTTRLLPITPFLLLMVR